MLKGKEDLKPKLGKEPPVFSCFEPLFQPLFDSLTSGYFLVLGLKRVDCDGVFQVDVEGVSCGHQVLVVHELDEALDAQFLGGFLGGVLEDDLARVLFYPRDQTVAIGTVTCAVVEGFYDHSFASGVSALEDNDSFVGL